MIPNNRYNKLCLYIGISKEWELTQKTRLILGEVSTLTIAAPNTQSLRTTVPQGICKQFNLKQRDQLDWTIEARDGKLVIVVTPKRKEKR
jgi:hypothetical protein